MSQLFVISAPSGSGKTTLCQRVLARRRDFCYSVSYTTRSPRPQEKDGLDYNFVSLETFQGMIKNDEFLEWAEVFDKYYGTGRAWVLEKLARGLNVLVDIDILGARQIKDRWPQAVLIFVVPPTYEELARRLAGRLTEKPEAVTERLSRAATEIAGRHLYDYLLINDDLERATEELLAILSGRPGRLMRDMEEFWPRFFLNHPDLLRLRPQKT